MNKVELTKSQFEELRALAESFTLQDPVFNILKKDRKYPIVTVAIEDHFQKLHDRNKLLLPELTKEEESIAVFSDYGGEHKESKYRTYSFLICSFTKIGYFLKAMKAVRERYNLGDKEISYKDFRYGPIKRSLADYLSALNNFTPGLLFTLVVDKDIDTLYGENGKADKKQVSAELSDLGIGNWKPDVAEKMITIVHVISYLVSLLANKHQKIFWMTDHDSIAEKNNFQDTLKYFKEILYYYSDSYHPIVSGAVPFKEKNLMTLDLLSATDIVAGSLEYYFSFSKKGKEKNNNEAYKVMEWLSNDGIALKKQTIIIRKHGKETVSASINFEVHE